MALKFARRQAQGAVFGRQGVAGVVAQEDQTSLLISGDSYETCRLGDGLRRLLEQNLILYL
jgi:hypothetical protein